MFPSPSLLMVAIQNRVPFRKLLAIWNAICEYHGFRFLKELHETLCLYRQYLIHTWKFWLPVSVAHINNHVILFLDIVCFPPIINGLIRSNYTVYFWLSNLVPIFHLLRWVVFQIFVPSFPTSFTVWPIIPATEVYVFQFLCYAVWPQTGLVNLALFLVWTYASAYLLAKCVQQPIQRLELVHNIFLGKTEFFWTKRTGMHPEKG